MKTLLAGIALAWAAPNVLAQPLTLNELLFRASQSVVAYERVFLDVVVVLYFLLLFV